MYTQPVRRLTVFLLQYIYYICTISYFEKNYKINKKWSKHNVDKQVHYMIIYQKTHLVEAF